MKIKTKRLILREFNNNDLNAIFDIFKDEITNIFLPWFPLKNIEEANEFYENRIKSIYKNCYFLAICLKENNIPIGYINMSADDSFDLGYGLKSDYFYKGIMKEAAKAFIKMLKEKGIPYITATHDINNPNSGKVMKAIGMKYCYSYLENWMPKNKLVTFRMYQLNLDDNNKIIYQKYCENSTTHFIEENI